MSYIVLPVILKVRFEKEFGNNAMPTENQGSVDPRRAADLVWLLMTVMRHEQAWAAGRLESSPM